MTINNMPEEPSKQGMRGKEMIEQPTNPMTDAERIRILEASVEVWKKLADRRNQSLLKIAKISMADYGNKPIDFFEETVKVTNIRAELKKAGY